MLPPLAISWPKLDGSPEPLAVYCATWKSGVVVVGLTRRDAGDDRRRAHRRLAGGVLSDRREGQGDRLVPSHVFVALEIGSRGWGSRRAGLGLPEMSPRISC